MGKHTPRPWEYGGISGIPLTFDREVNIYPPTAGTGEEQHGGPLAVVSVGESGEANALLMWAAPDLLAALEECLLNTGGGWISAAVIERARAAVAKAKPVDVAALEVPEGEK